MADVAMRVAVVLTAVDRMSAVVERASRGATARLNAFSDRTGKMADKAFNAGQQLTAAGLAIGAPIYKAVEAASEFETKMIDIRKQMANDSPEGVKAMTADVFRLSKQMPLATGEIQEMIAASLRMGVAQDQVIGFTQDVTKMAVAFDMPAGEIADSMGKIANVFNIPITQVGKFADAINYLDDNTMAQGPDIINVLQRIGGSARNLSPEQAAALASTMLSLGESAETSGTAISNMINMLSSANMQGKRFQQGMHMIGMSSAEVQKAMGNKEAAQATMLSVLDAVSKLNPEKQTEAMIRLFGQDHGPKLMKLANNTKLYAAALDMVKGKQAGSMDKEYQKRIQSSAAQMVIFKNRLQELAVKAGTTLLPALNKLLVWAGNWMEKLSAFMEAHPGLVEGLMKAAAAASAVALAGGYLSFVFGGIFRMVSIGARIFSFLSTAIRIIAVSFQFLSAVIMAFPIVGWIIAIITAIILLIVYWKKIVAWVKWAFNALKGEHQGFLGKVIDFAKAWFKWLIWPILTAIKFFRAAYKSYKDSGGNIVKAIGDGIKAAAHVPIDLIRNMVTKIRRFLPFSPAKEGPLKDLNRIRFVQTLAESIDNPNTLIAVVRRMAGKALNVLMQPGGGNRVAPVARSGGGGGSQFAVTVNLSGGATAKDGQMVGDALTKQLDKWYEKKVAQEKRRTFS